MTPEPPVLECRNLVKRFGHVYAVRGVSFSVGHGEVVALVGDNGAGKSTVIKTIAGVLSPDDGGVLVNGHPRRVYSPHAANTEGIDTVYQDLALAENLDVVANLFLGRERTALRFLDEESMEAATLETLRSLDVRVPNVRDPVASLSGGQRQAVAVARAMLWRSQLVQLDEPTAALGVEQSRQVLDLVRRLKETGVSVMVVSHNLVDVLSVADRVVVLRLGRVAGLFDASATNADEIVGAITGAARLDGRGGEPAGRGRGGMQ